MTTYVQDFRRRTDGSKAQQPQSQPMRPKQTDSTPRGRRKSSNKALSSDEQTLSAQAVVNHSARVSIH